MNIHDISPSLSPKTAVFPGDTELSRDVLLDMRTGDHLTLSTLRTTVHVGSHADGANHYERAGAPIDQMPLTHYLGHCQVVEAKVTREPDGTSRPRVAMKHLAQGIASGAERVLFKTGTQPNKGEFNDDFAGLEPALIDELGSRGIITIGMDTPSVDVSDSKDLPSHAACARNRIAIIEGLVLDDVAPGMYELIALPLRLEGFDASPVRAVLREIIDG